MDNIKSEIFEYDLSPRQIKQAQLMKDAYKRIIIWTNKGKNRLLNPQEVAIFTYDK